MRNDERSKRTAYVGSSSSFDKSCSVGLVEPGYKKIILVMPGRSAGHPRISAVSIGKSWMAGTSPAMTGLCL
jgi:hypothetical protein